MIASYAGSDVHPAWWLNLKDAGEGWIEVGTERLRVVPSVLDGDARERNWKTMAASYPDYDNYKKKTSRNIPVIALQPA